MRLNWPQFLARGEFCCFLLAWVLGIAVAVAEFSGRGGSPTGSNMAATGGAMEPMEFLD